MTRREEFELIIIGAGPAGLCAAMYAGRGMLRAVVLERGVPGGELLNTEWIDDYPGFEHILGRDLAQKMTAHALTFGADIRQENVESITRRDEFRASRILQERLFANPKIEVIWNKRVRELKGGPAGLEWIEMVDTVTGEELALKVSGCFIFIGFRPNTGLVTQHVDHDPSGYIITDERMMTSIPGLFAAGDLRMQLTRQVTTAVGDATTAAIAVEKYLKDRRSDGVGAQVGV
jgi:thioredoxin reductase